MFNLSHNFALLLPRCCIYPYGNILLRYFIPFFASRVLSLLRFLSLLGFLADKRWLLPPGEYLIFRRRVNLNLFATPFFVFNFGICFSSSLRLVLAKCSSALFAKIYKIIILLLYIQISILLYVLFRGEHKGHNPALQRRLFFYLAVTLCIHNKFI